MGLHVPAKSILTPELYEPGRRPNGDLVEIDWNNPLTSKLNRSATYIPGSYPMQDEISRTGVHESPFKGEFCNNRDASGTTEIVADNTSRSGMGPWGFVLRVWFAGTEDVVIAGAGIYNDSNSWYTVLHADGALNYISRRSSGARQAKSVASVMPAGQWVNIGFSGYGDHNTSDYYWVVNGVEVGQSATLNLFGFPFNAPSQDFRFYRYGDAGTDSGSLVGMSFWVSTELQKPFTLADLKELTTDPFQILRPKLGGL